MIAAIDVATLPAVAQRILDPAGPAPMKAMAAKGIVPGLRPADVLSLLVIFMGGADEALATTARATIGALPPPMLKAALDADLEPAAIAELCNAYLAKNDVMERLLGMPRIAMETVEHVAGHCGEAVAELIAVNEHRMLGHPPIIERLYMNKSTRMSTADRIIELAVRNHLELTGVPAYKEVAIAIGQELVAEPTAEPTPDDLLFRETLDEGARLVLDPEAEDTHALSDDGEEKVVEKFVPLYVRIQQMTNAQKIRCAMLGGAAERLLLMRDNNRLVAASAIQNPLVQEPEVVAISASRVVNEEVLRAITRNREWLRNHRVKFNLVTNPRTPFAMAIRLVPHLREHELKSIAKSKNVTAPIALAAKQQLDRKTK